MVGHGILRVVLVAVLAAFYVFSYEASCSTTNDTMAEPKTPAPTGSPSLASYTLRADLIRRDSPDNPFVDARNLSYSERLRRAIQRSHNKLRSFQNAGALHSARYYSPVNYENYEFLMQIGIGSPKPLNLHFILDTGSDLIWTQCAPCAGKHSCVRQQDPLYKPSHSSSFQNDSCSSVFCKAVQGQCDGLSHCNYFYMYGDSSSTTGNMAYETFSLRQVGNSQGSWASLPHVSFGCGRSQGGSFSSSTGIIGLGRGPLSLVSQIGSSIDNVFSYCFGPISNASQISPLFFGNTRMHSLRHRVTRLIRNPANPSFYYIRPRSIKVAGKAVRFPRGTFRIKPNGEGGMIIDSGTTLTYLEDPAYMPLLEAVRSSIPALPVNGSSTGLDLCYNAQSAPPRFPTISFHFAGGSRYVLPKQNSFISMKDPTGDLVCLAMTSAGSAGSMSIFGNIQQQNFHIAYDLAQNKLHFARANCASL